MLRKAAAAQIDGNAALLTIGVVYDHIMQIPHMLADIFAFALIYINIFTASFL